MAQAYRFGVFELDVSRGELLRDGQAVRLQPQPYRALEKLVERAGELVTREELRQHLWPEDIHVDFEQGLNYCVRQLRAALVDDAARPLYIETVPKRGYRFLAPVTVVGAATESPSNTDQPVQPAETRKPPKWRIAILVAGVLLLAGLFLGWRQPWKHDPPAKLT